MPDRNTPGARSTDLDPARVLAGYLTGNPGPPGNPSGGIQTGGPEDWMGPGNPLWPTAPAEVKGRRFDFPIAYNVETQPRAYEGVRFGELRALADAYDVLRLVLETRKDQMERLSWAIVPKKRANGQEATSVDDPLIEEIAEFLERPDQSDPNSDWGTWLRSLLEDMFVVDAATIYLPRTRAGKLAAAEQLDGAIIKRVIDDWGRTPPPPLVAYQEILHGFPAVNYSADEILYLPRNRRSGRVYGLSHVEQVVMTVNIGLRREAFTLQYFSEGTMPDALVGTPADWTPKQVADFQAAFDSMLAGNGAARRKIKFLPGDVAKTYVPLKEPELSGKFDEWLARIVCYAFSVPPTPFVTQNNRATAESAHDTAIEEGLAPVQNWVKRLVDNIIRRGWPGAKVEFVWNDDRETDPTADAGVRKTYVTTGLKTLNEGRSEMGLTPIEGGDRAMVLTATGYVPIDAPEPVATTAAAPGQEPAAPSSKPDPTEDEKAAQEGPAAKAATFRQGKQLRKGSWWNAPRGAHAPHASGTARGKASR